MKKVFLALILAAVVGGVYYASSSSSTGEKMATKAPVENALSTVTVVAPWEMTSLNPNQTGVIFQRMNIAETLVEANLQGELVPNLATSWESNAEGSIWRFTLQSGVIFHNHQPLTAAAVANSLNIALAKPGILQKAFIKQIRAINDSQVEIELTKPFIPFPSFLTHYTTLILAPEAYNQQGEVTSLIGTGRFKATKIEAPQKLETVRFEDYWGTKPQLMHANYLSSGRSESRMLMAQSDPTALVFNLDPASIERVKTDPNLTLTSGAIARTIQLKMDVAKPFFKDLAIRKALSQAINRRAIAESVLKIDSGIADQILPKAFAEWRIDALEQMNDIAKIKADLTASGYQYNAEGHLVDQQGNPFSFTLRTYSDRPELPIIATILQAQWKQIGIDVNVSIGNFSEIPAGHQDGSLEMALYAYNYGKTLDPFGVIVQDYAKNGSDWGVMNWQNSILDNALVQLETEQDAQKVKQLKQTVSRIIYDELPIIPVVYYQQNVVSHKHIKNVTLDPFERRFFLEKLTQ
ncbi:peptide/nickel transport system substrate-binding protein [Nicoletella semolina]|uniref:Peptide/nickel transport system substrate-binding protein n=1 Tax=Nicoletella semolina TaxID=271160 RepID=A0A4R2N4D3_9PAST|nr:ABC transporter substrate-binding protein [Nicoletella semolina]MDH2925093.1 ABC transporter substrate-binding protein [Nicoletella semolina]TCP15390.1 peptide/nickel transport system substrate-binding protein [Nicoletella semolina]